MLRRRWQWSDEDRGRWLQRRGVIHWLVFCPGSPCLQQWWWDCWPAASSPRGKFRVRIVVTSVLSFHSLLVLNYLWDCYCDLWLQELHVPETSNPCTNDVAPGETPRLPPKKEAKTSRTSYRIGKADQNPRKRRQWVCCLLTRRPLCHSLWLEK